MGTTEEWKVSLKRSIEIAEENYRRASDAAYESSKEAATKIDQKYMGIKGILRRCFVDPTMSKYCEELNEVFRVYYEEPVSIANNARKKALEEALNIHGIRPKEEDSDRKR